MSIKRYTPKFKPLPRLRQPLWLEKSLKIKKFSKEKWQNLRRILAKPKLKHFNQDISSLHVSDQYKSKEDFSTRLKKTYRFTLHAKQRLQKFYGMGRLKHYQLKKIAINARRKSKSFSCSSSRVFQHLLEVRLALCLYRTGVVRSLLQSRRLVESGKVKILGDKMKTSFLILPKERLLSIDPFQACNLVDQFLKYRLPLFYFRQKELRKKLIFYRKEQSQQDLIQAKKGLLLNYYKKKFQVLIYGKKTKRFLW